MGTIRDGGWRQEAAEVALIATPQTLRMQMITRRNIGGAAAESDSTGPVRDERSPCLESGRSESRWLLSSMGWASSGLGETLDRFTGTALAPLPDGTRKFYSRPALLTRSYEARRHLAIELGSDFSASPHAGGSLQYHWWSMITGNRIGDLIPTTLRLLFRRPSTVQAGFSGVWRLIWGIVVLAVVIALLVFLMGWAGAVVAALSLPVVVFIGGALLALVRRSITATFVDVVRYLDTSPRSYAARRAIRGGMVDLLRALQDCGDYARVVVVAHSLGAFIAYDGICSLWDETAGRSAGPVDTRAPLTALAPLEDAASALLASSGSVEDFRGHSSRCGAICAGRATRG